LQTRTTPYTFRNTVSHEMGHAFTHNSEHIGEGNLMYVGEWGNIQEGVEQGDIDYFWQAR